VNWSMYGGDQAASEYTTYVTISAFMMRDSPRAVFVSRTEAIRYAGLSSQLGYLGGGPCRIRACIAAGTSAGLPFT
jgi:hypothetical protein